MAVLGFHSVAEFVTFVTFVLLGMSIMMVVSAITSAPDFVSQYYKFATGDEHAEAEAPEFWDNANTFYNVGTYIAQLTFEPLALIPFVRTIPLRLRLAVGLTVPLLELLLLIIIPAAKIPTQNGAIAVLMVIAVMGGFSKALCNSCTNALVGPFPTKFMNGAMWGLAVSALFMSVLQIVLMSAMGDSYDSQLTQSRIYLGIAVGIQSLSLFMFLILYKNPFACKYAAEFRMMHKGAAYEDNEEAEHVEGVEAEGEIVSGLDKKSSEPVEGEIGEAPAADTKEDAADGHGAVLRMKGDADHMEDADQVGNITSGQQMANTSLWPVVKKVYPMLGCAFLVFFVTLLLFPGVFFAVEDDGWYWTMIVLLFNIGDFSSRILLMIRPLRPSPMYVVIGTVGRIIIVVPLLALCVHGSISGRWMPYILITFHGLTNGYVGAMAMIHCPRTPALSTAGERSLAAIISGVALMLGLCLGSNFALLVNLLI